jgi:signal transduction histidine kinase
MKNRVFRTLTRQITLMLAACILLTTAVVMTPVYLLVRAELEGEMWRRMDDGLRYTQTLLDAQFADLRRTVLLAAERPTLARLLRDGTADELAAYLREFQNNTALDTLAVTNTAGRVIGGTLPPDGLSMIYSAPTESGASVIGAVRLDAALAAQLQAKTGFQYRFVADPASMGRFQTHDGAPRAYGDWLSLDGLANSSGAAVELRLPLEGWLANETRIVTLVGLSTISVALVASALGAVIVRRRLRPARAWAESLLQSLNQLQGVTDDTRRSLQAYFLANISHEFRTPLAGMRVSIELLLENLRSLSYSETVELLNSLYLSVAALQTLIDNLLESSRIEANYFTLSRQPTEIATVVGEAMRFVQPFLTRRQQTLNLDAPLVLPPVRLDPTRVTQVLVNLLANASKYSPMAAPIDLTIDVDDDTVRIAVADRGEGVPDDQRDRVFGRFARAGSGGTQGTGLGLAVVKAIVEAHGGAVGMRPRDGGGSEFWFTLALENGEHRS